MSESWTPGPWEICNAKISLVGRPRCRIEEFTADIYPHENNHGYRGNITTIQSCNNIDGIDSDEAEANAKLITAAPDMWDALAALVEHNEHLIEAGVLRPFAELERANAALKKARGES